MPDHPPLDSYVAGCNSTSITLSWGNIPDDRVHGIFVKYFVSLLETHADGQLGRNFTVFTNITFLVNITMSPNLASQNTSLGNSVASTNFTASADSSSSTNSTASVETIATVERHSYTFTNLTPYTNYSFRIGGCTEVGCGVPLILEKRTDESGL